MFAFALGEVTRLPHSIDKGALPFHFMALLLRPSSFRSVRPSLYIQAADQMFAFALGEFT